MELLKQALWTLVLLVLSVEAYAVDVTTITPTGIDESTKTLQFTQDGNALGTLTGSYTLSTSVGESGTYAIIDFSNNKWMVGRSGSSSGGFSGTYTITFEEETYVYGVEMDVSTHNYSGISINDFNGYANRYYGTITICYTPENSGIKRSSITVSLSGMNTGSNNKIGVGTIKIYTGDKSMVNTTITPTAVNGTSLSFDTDDTYLGNFSASYTIENTSGTTGTLSFTYNEGWRAQSESETTVTGSFSSTVTISFDEEVYIGGIAIENSGSSGGGTTLSIEDFNNVYNGSGGLGGTYGFVPVDPTVKRKSFTIKTGAEGYGTSMYTTIKKIIIEASKLVPDVTAHIDGWTYGTTAISPTAEGNPEGNTMEQAVWYSSGSEEPLASAPVTAGDYEVVVTTAETAHYESVTAAAVPFTISPADITAVAVNDLTAPATDDASFDAEATATLTSTPSVASLPTTVVAWKKGDADATSPVEHSTVYQAVLTVTNTDYNFRFADEPTVTVDGAEVSVVRNSDNQLTVTATYPATAAKYTVTAAEGTTNGTLSFSPALALPGTEITITATPAEDYSMSSLAVSGNGGQRIALIDNKFTMPAGNVVVTATFKANGDVNGDGTVDVFDILRVMNIIKRQF